MTFDIRRAGAADADGISAVCSTAYRATYQGLTSDAFIQRSIDDFYQPDRIRSEIDPNPPGWLGYVVAADQTGVIGAAGGGLTEPGVAELYVLYVDPNRRNEGIGTALLESVCASFQQHNAHELRVSVIENNELGLPFYRARGFVPFDTVPAYGSLPEERLRSLRLARPLIPQQREAR